MGLCATAEHHTQGMSEKTINKQEREEGGVREHEEGEECKEEEEEEKGDHQVLRVPLLRRIAAIRS